MATEGGDVAPADLDETIEVVSVYPEKSTGAVLSAEKAALGADADSGAKSDLNEEVSVHPPRPVSMPAESVTPPMFDTREEATQEQDPDKSRPPIPQDPDPETSQPTSAPTVDTVADRTLTINEQKSEDGDDVSSGTDEAGGAGDLEDIEADDSFQNLFCNLGDDDAAADSPDSSTFDDDESKRQADKIAKMQDAKAEERLAAGELVENKGAKDAMPTAEPAEVDAAADGDANGAAKISTAEEVEKPTTAKPEVARIAVVHPFSTRTASPKVDRRAAAQRRGGAAAASVPATPVVTLSSSSSSDSDSPIVVPLSNRTNDPAFIPDENALRTLDREHGPPARRRLTRSRHTGSAAAAQMMLSSGDAVASEADVVMIAESLELAAQADVLTDSKVLAAGRAEVTAIGHEQVARRDQEHKENLLQTVQGELSSLDDQLNKARTAGMVAAPAVDDFTTAPDCQLSLVEQLRQRIEQKRRSGLRARMDELSKKKETAQAEVERWQKELSETELLLTELSSAGDGEEFRSEVQATMETIKGNLSTAKDELQSVCEEMGTLGAASPAATAEAAAKLRTLVADRDAKRQQVEALERQIDRGQKTVIKLAKITQERMAARRLAEEEAAARNRQKLAALSGAKRRQSSGGSSLAQEAPAAASTPSGSPMPLMAKVKNKAAVGIRTARPAICTEKGKAGGRAVSVERKAPPKHHRKLTVDRPSFEPILPNRGWWPGLPVHRTNTDPAKVERLKLARQTGATDGYTMVNYRYMPTTHMEVLSIILLMFVERYTPDVKKLYKLKPTAAGGLWHFSARDKLTILSQFALYLKENGITNNPFFMVDFVVLRQFIAVAHAKNSILQPYQTLSQSHMLKWLLDADLILLFADLDSTKRMDDAILARLYAEQGADAVFGSIPPANRALLGNEAVSLLQLVSSGGDWEPVLEALKASFPGQKFNIDDVVQRKTEAALASAKAKAEKAVDSDDPSTKGGAHKEKRRPQPPSTASSPSGSPSAKSARIDASIERVRLVCSESSAPGRKPRVKPASSGPTPSKKDAQKGADRRSTSCKGADGGSSGSDEEETSRLGHGCKVLLSDGSFERTKKTKERVRTQTAIYSSDQCICNPFPLKKASKPAMTVRQPYSVDMCAAVSPGAIRAQLINRLSLWFGRNATVAVVLVDIVERELVGQRCPRAWPSDLTTIDSSKFSGKDALLIIGQRPGHICSHQAWLVGVVVNNCLAARMTTTVMRLSAGAFRQSFEPHKPVWARGSDGNLCLCEGTGEDTAPIFHFGCRSVKQTTGERHCIYKDSRPKLRVDLKGGIDPDADIIEHASYVDEVAQCLADLLLVLAPCASRNMTFWSDDAASCRIGKHKPSSPFSWCTISADASRHIWHGTQEMENGVSVALFCREDNTDGQDIVLPSLRQLTVDGKAQGKMGLRIRPENGSAFFAPMRCLDIGISEVVGRDTDFPSSVVMMVGQSGELLRSNHGAP